MKHLNKKLNNSKGSISEVRFNYLGQLGTFSNDLLQYETSDTGKDINIKNRLSAKLDIICMIIEGELQIVIHYPKQLFSPATIDRFKKEFIDQIYNLINYINTQKDIRLSPSDFDAATLDSDDLVQIFTS
jgi:non-ribosomal peptide synthase protein (TIGR01720 family)